MQHRSIALAVLIAACSRSAPEPTATESAPPPRLAGQWRAELTSPGGPLPFGLFIEKKGDGYRAWLQNAEERAPITTATVDGNRITLRIEHYDATIRAELKDDRLTGNWEKTIPDGKSTLPFAATRGAGARFSPRSASGDTRAKTIAGSWEVTFRDEDGTFPAVGEFQQQGSQVVGTFLTATGDYRFLEGVYEGGRLRLSTFDGAHAFLFAATVDDNHQLQGDFWSRDSYHATWSAKRLTPERAAEVLPDPYREVTVESADRKLRFDFPMVGGGRLRHDSPRFQGKVVIVDIFGTWCPNCNDQAPLLAKWHRRYRDRGLEVVGLAYEFSGEPERDQHYVAEFARRHGIEYPLLLAGTSDKKKAALTLPDLSAIKSYPTTVLIGRDGRVRKVHSGFAGPGTGRHYDALVTELEASLEELLREPAPGAVTPRSSSSTDAPAARPGAG